MVWNRVSLPVVQAMAAAAQKGGGMAPDASDVAYLGLLYPTDEYKVYG